MTKRILVTGGSGFIGSHFVLKLLSLGHSILNIDIETYATEFSLHSRFHHQKSGKYEHLKFNICETNKLIKSMMEYKPDYVIHFAAESHVDNSILKSKPFIDTNIYGTYSLLEAIRTVKDNGEFPKKVISVSTDEVFGSIITGKFNEKSNLKPNSPYSASKAASDLLVRAWTKTYNLPIIISNCSNNYGPGQHIEKLIPKTIYNILNGHDIPIYGNGNNVRDWIYVEDHVDALMKLIDKGRIGQRYVIGADCEKTNLEIVFQICEIMSQISSKFVNCESLIQYVDDRLGHDYRYATDSKKMNVATNWKATTKLGTGLFKTIEYYMTLQRFGV